MSTFSNYMLAARKESYRALGRYDKELSRVYIDLAGQVKADLYKATTYKGRLHQEQVVKALLNAAGEANDEFKSLLDKALLEAAGITPDAVASAMGDSDYWKVLESAVDVPPMGAVMHRIPKEAVETLYRRVREDGLKLSDRVWKLGKNTENGVSRILIDGLAKGLHYDDPAIAAQLDRFLQPARMGKPVSKVITRKLKDGTEFSFRQRPVSYDAARLLRTEWGNAYREAGTIAAQRNPACTGERWLLSGTHPDIGCECEEYAAHDEGLGEGVYPVGELPWDAHPNCLCTSEQVVISIDEFVGWAEDFIKTGEGPIADWYNEVGYKLAA